MKSTLEEFSKNLSNIVTCFGGDFPAVDIEFVLILLDGSLGGYFPFWFHIDFIANDHENYLIQIEILIYMVLHILASLIQDYTSR